MASRWCQIRPDLYDLFYSPKHHNNGDIKYYVGLVDTEKSSKKILEIGSGTGRITIPLLKGGHTITAVEISQESCNWLTLKVQENHLKKDKLLLISNDIMNVELEDEFDFILLPFRVFQHFYEEDEQIVLLKKLYNLLPLNGKLILDVFYPEWKILTQNIGEAVLFSEDKRGNEIIKRYFFKEEVNLLSQYFRGYWKYELYKTQNMAKTIIEPFKMGYYTYNQLSLLFRISGFKIIECLGSFAGSPLGKGNEIIIQAMKNI
ncbi:class I SAM-dependent methyltransferase [Candidatus Cardinium hertigii]|uniref:Glycine/sarcosine N-methyltransferase n=1 Tax=Candidatus Cardinium hertigii TaxID=247481 RepID=A0A2Z3LHJ3_9BACT|nr:class I SAM-dependent methyltransferase [Candidatus Cardinium hertigii]AWN81520.1 Glycine/sarcosine N-methyltransferase [Candidatus Cardinium hertigii]